MRHIALIATGHGYEFGECGRCTAFDGFEVLANPLGGNDAVSRESRHFPQPDGSDGTTYASFSIKLACRPEVHGRRSGDLFILFQSGSGRQVWCLPEFSDHGAMQKALLAMPERELYGLLYAMVSMADAARRQGISETENKWESAYLEGRIKKRRATRTRAARLEIEPRKVADADAPDPV